MTEKKPYVISAELELVGAELVRPRNIDEFRQDLESDLTGMGKRTVWLEAALLRDGMEALLAGTNLPVVSLDRRYATRADAFIEVSRAVHEDLSEAGYDARLTAPPLAAQFDELGRRYGNQEVLLADDVVFSGEMLAWVQRQLTAREVKVAAVACGVAIGEGSGKLAARGIEVESVVTFALVEDEICERDFTTLAGSGRKLIGQQMSALYFDPKFGKPEQWASLPAAEVNYFCVGSLVRNLALVQPDAPFPKTLGYPQGTNEKVLRRALYERTK